MSTRELAQVVIWIGYLQWMIGNGFTGLDTPILESLETIRLQDALLDRSDGQVRETTWPAADFIIGNPPFLGDKRLRRELGHSYVDDLFAIFGNRIPNGADLVCYFFEKGRAQIEADSAKRAGLLATKSIRGGANREVLKRIKRSGEIFMAWADEPWILNGAAVRISIIGFDDGLEQDRILDGDAVPAINSNLTAAIDTTAAKPLPANLGVSFRGDTKAGLFEIAPDVARSWLALLTNTNGRPNSDVIRPWLNGLDVAHRPRGMYIIDFGVDMSEQEAALYEAPFEYVRAHVKPERDRTRRDSYRHHWWIHGEPRPALREALRGKQRYIAAPMVAKHRLFTWVCVAILPDQQLIVFARDDDYFFGVLHSRAHEVWSLRMGTSLEDRPRYTPTTCFETFPLPWPPGTEPAGDPKVAAIANAAKTFVTSGIAMRTATKTL